jgi:hypothetical protein
LALSLLGFNLFSFILFNVSLFGLRFKLSGHEVHRVVAVMGHSLHNVETLIFVEFETPWVSWLGVHFTADEVSLTGLEKLLVHASTNALRLMTFSHNNAVNVLKVLLRVFRLKVQVVFAIVA